VAEVREQGKPLLQKRYELICHFLKLVDIAVPIHVAEPCANWVVHKENVGELVPRAVDEFQISPFLDSVRPNLHQRAVFRTAAWPTIQPYHGPGFVGKVFVLKVPEEQVTVVFGCHFDVAIRLLAIFPNTGVTRAYPACIFKRGCPSGAPGRECTK
jgi:hypothetical protein